MHQAVCDGLIEALALILGELSGCVNFNHKMVMRVTGSFTFSQVTRTRVPSVASLFLRRYWAA